MRETETDRWRGEECVTIVWVGLVNKTLRILEAKQSRLKTVKIGFEGKVKKKQMASSFFKN